MKTKVKNTRNRLLALRIEALRRRLDWCVLHQASHHLNESAQKVDTPLHHLSTQVGDFGKYNVTISCTCGACALLHTITGNYHIVSNNGHWASYELGILGCDDKKSSPGSRHSWGREDFPDPQSRLSYCDIAVHAHTTVLFGQKQDTVSKVRNFLRKRREWEDFQRAYKGTRLYAAARKAGFEEFLPSSATTKSVS